MKRLLPILALVIVALMTMAQTQQNADRLFKGKVELLRGSGASAASGNLNVYADDATGKLACKDSSGTSCMPAGGAIVSSAGIGYWAPFGPISHLQNQTYTASRFYFFQFVLDYQVAIDRVSFYNGTALAASKGIRWSVWNGAFDTILCKSAVIVTADTPGSSVVTKSPFTTSCTLQPGIYFIGFGTDDGSASFSQASLATFSPVGGMLNQNSVVRVGYCANTMTGSSTTLDFPSSCGSRTADLSNFLPQLVLEP